MVLGTVPVTSLAVLRQELDGWLEESCSHSRPWGETVDGRARFHVALSHSAAGLVLRRIDSPQRMSLAYCEMVFDGVPADLAAELIGPDIKFHYAKINLKLPGNRFAVDDHQDFRYTPHTNDDLITVLLLLDDLGQKDGTVKVGPGFHCQGQKSLWQEGVSTGKVGQQTTAECEARTRLISGKAGDLCFLHTSLLHVFAEHVSDNRRAFLLSVYSAADAFPLAPSLVPNEFEGTVVRGRGVRSARVPLQDGELPANYRAVSFFSVHQNEDQPQGKSS